MTKCIVLGGEPKTEYKKPIEFVHLFSIGLMSVSDDFRKKPADYNHLELIKAVDNGNGERFDLIFGHMGTRKHGNLYLGHWNDGIVE